MILSRVPTPALAEELISRPDGRTELGRLMRPPAPRAKALKPCPHCSQPFGARDMRAHMHHCPGNANRRTLRTDQPALDEP